MATVPAVTNYTWFHSQNGNADCTHDERHRSPLLLPTTKWDYTASNGYAVKDDARPRRTQGSVPQLNLRLTPLPYRQESDDGPLNLPCAYDHVEKQHPPKYRPQKPTNVK